MNKGSRALLAAARFELGVQDLPPQEKRTLFMLRSLNLSRRLYLLIAVFTISFSIFGLWSFKTLHEIKVGGEVFHRIGESKDLVSDLLPPPLYIVESYLLCLQLDRTTDASRAPDLVQRLRFLETQYRQRHAHWQERLGTLGLPTSMLDELNFAADAFFDEVWQNYLPSLEDHQPQARKLALEKLNALYEQHRHAVDMTIPLAEAHSAQEENWVAHRVTSETLWLLGVLVLSLLAAIGLAHLIRRSIAGPLAKAVDVAQKVAAGDWQPAPECQGYHDEPGQLLTALYAMAATLQQQMEALGRSEARSRHARELLEKLIESADIMVVGVDPKGRMALLNDAAARASGYSLTLTPQPAALNTSVSLKAAVDPTGANAAMTPATCTADGSPSAGCAVSRVVTVTATPTQYPPVLSLRISNPVLFMVGQAADYSLSITNAGPGPTEQTLVLYELIPPYMTLNEDVPDGGGSVAAESVSCAVGTTPPGAPPGSQLQICTVRLPSGGLPAGGTTQLRINVTPRAPSVSTTAVNKVALDPAGRNLVMNPVLCNSTGIPAGCAVTPALEVRVAARLLYLAKFNPPQLVTGKVATYVLVVTNRGSMPTSFSTLSVNEKMPPYMDFMGANLNSMGTIRGLGLTCYHREGLMTNGLHILCNIDMPPGRLAPGDSVGISVHVRPTAQATGSRIPNRAAVDSTSENEIVRPALVCIATDNPIGCAVADPLEVDAQSVLTLGMSLSPPASLVFGTPATYSALIQNTGGVFSGTNLVSYVQMPAGFQFSSVAPNANGSVTARAASCTAAGQLLTCTLTLPSGGMQNSNGTVGYSLTLTPQPAALNTSVSLKAAVDPTGANAAMTPSSCTANGSPAGCAVTVAQTVLSNVDLSLNSANPANLAVGLNSSYLLTVTNSGSVASGSTVVVYDQLPANVQFVSASVASLGTVTPTGVACNASGTVASGQLLTCTLSLPASGLPAGGGMAAFNLNVLPQVAASGSSSINKAIVDATGYNASKTPGSCVVTGNPAGCAVGASMTVGNGIALNLRKTNPGFLNPGATASYTLNLNNAGTGATGTSLVVYDQLPANVAYSSAAVSNLGSITPSAVSCPQAAGTVAAGQLMRCTLTLPSGGLTAGASTAFTINVLPNASSQGAQVSNSAAIDPTGNNAAQTPGSTCVATDNPAGCAVASPQVVGGGSFQIQLNRVGGGQGAANFIFASNAGGLVFNQSLTTTGSGSTVLAPAVTYVSTNNAPVNLSYTLPLGGWSVSAVSCLDSNAAVSGNPSQAVNAATLSPSVVVTGMQLSKGASILCSVTVALTDLSPMLSLSKANPPTLSVGQPASYGLSISNSGGLATGTSLVVYDQLPPDVQYSGAAPATGGKVVPTGVQCTSSGSVAAGQLLTCTVNLPAGGLAPNGGSANFSISVVPQLASVGVPLVNRAAIDPTGRSAVQFPSQCTANDAPTLGCAVTPELAPIQVGVSLSLQKTSPTSFKVGQSSNYVMKVTNAGVNTSGAKLMFLDQLPPNLVFNSISPAAGGSVLAESSSCTVSGDLNAGQLLNCSVQVPSGLPARSGSTAVLLNLTPLQAAAGLAVVNKASIDPTGANAAVPPATCTADGLPSAGCAVSSAVMVVANAPALSLSKSNPEMLMVGLAADYSLSITNAGPGPTEQTLVLYELIPANMTFNGAAPDGGSLAAESVSCVVGTTPPGAPAGSQLQICTVRLPSGGLPAGGTTQLRINVTPRASTTSATVLNKVALDPTGRNLAMNPALCSSTGIPAGCAVTTALQVVPTAPLLYLAKTNPPQLASGKVATYGLLVTNRGSKATGTTLTVYDQLPGNMAYSGAAVSSTGSINALSVACSQAGGTAAGGWNMRCTLNLPAGGLAPGASVGFSLNGTPSAATTGLSLLNIAAIDSTGQNALLTPRDFCNATDSPIGCAIPNPLVVDGGTLQIQVKRLGGAPGPVNVYFDSGGALALVSGLSETITVASSGGTTLGQYWSYSSVGGSKVMAFGYTLPSSDWTLTAASCIDSNYAVSGNPSQPVNSATLLTPTLVFPTMKALRGAQVLCTVTVTGAYPQLSLSKLNPGFLAVNQASGYALNVANTGKLATGTSLMVYDQLPPNLLFDGAVPTATGTVAPTGVSCSASGSVTVGQLLACSLTLPAGGVPPGGSAGLQLNVRPQLAAGGSSVSNKAAVDPSGENTVQTPASCTATGSPAGCAVTPALLVRGSSLTVGIVSSMPGSYVLTGNNGWVSQTINLVGSSQLAMGGTQALTEATITTLNLAPTAGSSAFISGVSCTGMGSGAVNFTNSSFQLDANATAVGNAVSCLVKVGFGFSLSLNKTSQGGVGSFLFSAPAASGWTPQTLSTTAPGQAVSGAAQVLTHPGVALRITESAPSGWNLSQVSCLDKNAA